MEEAEAMQAAQPVAVDEEGWQQVHVSKVSGRVSKRAVVYVVSGWGQLLKLTIKSIWRDFGFVQNVAWQLHGQADSRIACTRALPCALALSIACKCSKFLVDVLMLAAMLVASQESETDDELPYSKPRSQKKRRSKKAKDSDEEFAPKDSPDADMSDADLAHVRAWELRCCR